MQNKKDKIILNIIMIVLSMFAISLTVFSSTNGKLDIDSTTSKIQSSSTTITTSIPETTTEIQTTITTTEPKTTTKPKTTKKKVVKTTKKKTKTSSVLNGTYTIPGNGGKFKSYTNYKLLSKSSPQWKRIQCHKDAYTDKNGLRKIGDYYCVAMGSYYSTTLGDLFEIKTTGGTFKIVLCDFKANKHTDSTNRYTTNNGCVTEFYVDMNSLNPNAKRMGDISYADDKFSGKIISITKIGNIFN